LDPLSPPSLPGDSSAIIFIFNIPPYIGVQGGVQGGGGRGNEMFYQKGGGILGVGRIIRGILELESALSKDYFNWRETAKFNFMAC
jgi:hypothetical protein